MSDFRPTVPTPGMEPKKRRGMFVNPPGYAEIGGLTGPSKLNRGDKSLMTVEKHPTGKKGPL